MSINAAAAAAAAVSEIVDLRFIFLQFALQACSQLQVCFQLCLIQRERFRSYSHTSGLANAAEAIARATLCCYLGSCSPQIALRRRRSRVFAATFREREKDN